MIYLDPRGLRKYDHAALDQYSAPSQIMGPQGTR